MPHSHMDAGWLEKYEDLFKNKAKLIFEQTIQKLLENTMYTYTVGDISFFRRYYAAISPEE